MIQPDSRYPCHNLILVGLVVFRALPPKQISTQIASRQKQLTPKKGSKTAATLRAHSPGQPFCSPRLNPCTSCHSTHRITTPESRCDNKRLPCLCSSHRRERLPTPVPEPLTAQWPEWDGSTVSSDLNNLYQTASISLTATRFRSWAPPFPSRKALPWLQFSCSWRCVGSKICDQKAIDTVVCHIPSLPEPIQQI